MITRHLSKALGRQTFIPRRFLEGLLPGALIDAFQFWQNDKDDGLVGYPIGGDGESSNTASNDDGKEGKGGNGASSSNDDDVEMPRHLIRVDLYKQGSDDRSGLACSESFAVVRRVPFSVDSSMLPDAEELAKCMPQASPLARSMSTMGNASSEAAAAAAGAASGAVADEEEMTLLNVIHAPEGSVLDQLGKTLTRLDDLSHCLVWAKGRVGSPKEACAIYRVELPRVHLSFAVRAAPDEKCGLRLYCEQRDGMWITVRAANELHPGVVRSVNKRFILYHNHIQCARND